MPLDASITWGSKSSHGNGYREYLREFLTEAGYDVDIVGSRQSGSMVDNDVEGWPGERIDQVRYHVLDSVPKMLPNIITLNAGSNDCMQDYHTDNASSRVNDLIQDLWTTMPQFTIILSTLTPNAEPTVEDCVQRVNIQLKELVRNNQDDSKRIALADMRGNEGLELEHLADYVHPNDGGYNKMARIWFEVIQFAKRSGWLDQNRA
jgi:lysophospholipase L1-like esterase